jgi:hypothetical protein
LWGPDAIAGQVREEYAESPGHERVVQYFDKSRMEITHPNGDSGADWYVTNGLLVVELVTGRMQIGDASFDTREPADVNVAGDPGDASAPTYATFGGLLALPPAASGAALTQRLTRGGHVTHDASLASYGVTAAHRVRAGSIDHQVASPFWSFMGSSGTVYVDGRFTTGKLFADPFYATGYPISEAYWIRVAVGGDELDVLVQCFERRCLTYTPSNPVGWRVEAGNVGRHYYEWRYAAVLVGAGDIAACDSAGDEATARLLDSIEGVVFTAGDNVYPSGSLRQFNECYDVSWGRHKARTRPAPGNHEYQTDGAAGYFEYFGAAAGDPNTGYYSYDIGAYWHAIVLNSNCAKIGGCQAGSVQYGWLERDLEDHAGMNVIAFWHHPRYSSGGHGNTPELDDLWDMLVDYGAEIAITGHDHIYERFAPIDDDGDRDDARGLREFVVGTGGKSLTGVGSPEAHSEARSNEAFGVLKLTLYPEHYEWQFIPVEGEQFTDSGSTLTH